MARDAADATPIESRDQLVERLASGGKPKAEWRVGTEHEKFGFYQADHSPGSLRGRARHPPAARGMEGLLGWEPIIDGEHIIGLADPIGRARSRWSPAASSSCPARRSRPSTRPAAR